MNNFQLMFKIIGGCCILCFATSYPLFSQSHSYLNTNNGVEVSQLKTKLNATFEELKQKYETVEASNFTVEPQLIDSIPQELKNETIGAVNTKNSDKSNNYALPNSADIEREFALNGKKHGDRFNEELELLTGDFNANIIKEIESIRNEFEYLIDEELKSAGDEFKDELDQEVNQIREEFDNWLNNDIRTAKEAYRQRVNQEIESLWQGFNNDLGGNIDGLVLSELKKENVSDLISEVVNKYQSMEGYSNAFKADEGLQAKLTELGNEKISGELSNKISFAKIFDEFSPEIYADKIDFNRKLDELKNLSGQRQEIFNNWDLDQSSQNEYHKLLQGQISVNEFESRLKSSISSADKNYKAKYKELFSKIESIESDEDKVIEQLKGNSFLKEQKRIFSDSGDLFEKYDASNAYANDTFIKQLNQFSKSEDIIDLLKNDYVSQLLGQSQPTFGNVAGGVIEKDALSALDSIGEGWFKDAITTKTDLDKEKKEIEEVVLDDSNVKRLLPKSTFFEGIIGFANGDYSVFSVSPNFGYKIDNGPSLGLGLTLHHTQNDSANIRTAIDYKVFGKYELFNELIYIQAEYVFLVPGISYLEAETGAAEYKQTVLLGGGLSLKIKGKRMLSLGIMYNLNQNMGVPAYDAPLLARLGIKLF